MLHVFQIDAGRMLTFDISYAAETVGTLQDALTQSTNAPVSEQVLLVSGGEVLGDPERRVSRYSAGTDSNPIFLVIRHSGDLNRSTFALSCSPTPDLVNISDVENQISHSAQLPPSFQTIQSCVQHARRLVQAADGNVERCAQLVYDQHLLHQGWLAVIANLDDTVTAFRQRLIKFRDKIERFSSQRQRALDLLTSFDGDVQLLKKIPILPCLLASIDCGQSTVPAAGTSLFEWISSKEPEHKLQDLAVDARQALDRLLEPRILEHLATLEDATLDRAQDVAMKEIGGLGKRLARLDEYLQHVKKLQIEQRQYSESLRAQEQRAATVKENSIISDLCLNHLSAVRKMLDRQKQLADVTRRFCDAKTELLKNIHIRMRWVTETHQLIQTGDSKVMLNGERLHRLRRQLELLKQIHDAPFVYASAVTEVIRRKAFSREFLDWADRLTEKSKELCAEENRLRDIFAEKFDRHFLRTLFPGLEERTPEFANERPEPFDANLPDIEVEHVRELRSAVPQLQQLLFVQKPNVYDRVSVSSSAPHPVQLQRDVSFFSQTPPRYAAAATNVPVSGSAPVIIRNAIVRNSMSWFAGDDMELSPTEGGGHGRDGVLMAAAVGKMPNERDDVGYKGTIVSDSDSELAGGIQKEEEEAAEERHQSFSRTPRSAPIRIPSNQRTNDDDMIAMMSRGQFSEKGGSSGKFGTPDEHMMPGSADERHQTFKQALPLTTAVSTQCSGIVLNSVEDESCRRDLAERAQQLVEALESEQTLQRQLCERDMELDRHRAMLSSKILPELIEMRQFLNDVKRDFQNLATENENSQTEWSGILDKAARKLEENLQAALEETNNAENELRQRELDTTLDELRLQLEDEKNTAKESQKQLANNEAFLKEREEVIEMLQQRLQEQESVCAKQVEEAKADLMKRLVIEHELTTDNMRAEYEREIEIKKMEIQQLKLEVTEKQQVLRDMKKEQDRLVASMCERELVSGFITASSASPVSDQYRAEESEDRLRQTKQDLEREYRDKLQMLTAGMEAKYAQQLERVRKEKEIEIRMLKEKLEKASQDDQKLVSEEAAGPVQGVTGNVEDVATTPILEEPNVAIGITDSMYQTNTASVIVREKDLDELEEQEEDLFTDEQPSPEKRDASATSPELSPGKPLVSKKSRAVQTKGDGTKISILRIAKGDLVLLVFDPQFKTFVVFTVSPTLYILKDTCLQRMGCLQRSTNGQMASPSSATAAGAVEGELHHVIDAVFPKQRWILGRVVEMEYCQIKKPSNRYHLPVNTRFYRVAAEPVIIKPHS